jgi:hypothetical protein
VPLQSVVPDRLRDPRQDGATGLSMASQNGHPEVVRLLLGIKADPSLADEVQPAAPPGPVVPLLPTAAAPPPSHPSPLPPPFAVHHRSVSSECDAPSVNAAS